VRPVQLYSAVQHTVMLSVDTSLWRSGTEIKVHSPVTFDCRRGSVVIATRCGLEGPGIQSRWGRDFPHPSRPALGPTKPPTQGIVRLSGD